LSVGDAGAFGAVWFLGKQRAMQSACGKSHNTPNQKTHKEKTQKPKNRKPKKTKRNRLEKSETNRNRS
jgi:hypothetical protein